MSNEYLDSLNKLARKRQLALTKQQEKAIFSVYNKAAEDYYEKFINGMGNNTATNALQMEYAREIAKRLEEIITEYSIKGAENSLSLVRDIMDSAYDQYGLKDSPYAKSVHQIANALRDQSARRIILGDIYKDGKGLSKRLWNTTNRNAEAINEVIAQCMAQQLSAVETSKILKSFMKPGVGKTWDRAKIKEKLGPGYAAWNKEISYEALRLARTTINHSATLGMKEAGKLNPYLKSARWHSVHAIGRTCEQCKERDGQVYTLAQLPFDHPNGLCWNEPILDKSLDEIAHELQMWVEGGKNSRLDEYWKAHGPKDVPVPSQLPKKQQPIKKGTPEWYDKEFSNFVDQLGDHWENGIKEAIMKAPEFIQDWYRINQDKLIYAGEDGSSAYYSPRNRHIKMSLDADKNNTRGKYSTFFHEFGHLLDDLSSQNIMSDLSNNMAFYKALEKDYNDKLAQFGKDSKPWPFVKGKIVEAQRNAGDICSGVQDIYSGFSLNEIRAGWGHSTEYWKRGNTKLEIASEAWAHMSSGYTNEERLAVMKEWFPTACKEFERIVKQNTAIQLKNLK